MICNQLEECIDIQRIQQKNVKCLQSQDECIEVSDCRSNVKCEEKKKKYILENTMGNHVILYRMDGGIIKTDKSVPEGTCKCDYLMVVDGKECDAILTELKGVDVKHALKQIDGTLDQFKAVFNRFAHVYARAVVTSSTPNLKATPTYVKLMNKLRRCYKGNLKIEEVQMKEKDIDLDK